MKQKLIQMNMKPIVIILLCFLFISTLPNMVSTSNEKTQIYVVDKDSNADFCTISDAIDFASDGDTIQINNGMYKEHIRIDKSITIIGENKYKTIIDGNGTGDVIFIDTDGVSISSLTVRHSGSSGRDCGIELQGNASFISQVVVTDCCVGIHTRDTHNNTFINNICSDNKDYGIYVHTSKHNYIAENSIVQSRWGIFVYHRSNENIIARNWIENISYHGIWVSWSIGNTVKENVILDTLRGIYGYGFYNGLISRNHMKDNMQGIFLSRCNSILITENNFITNEKDASVLDASVEWDRNYWNRFRVMPKIIVDITPAIVHSFSFDIRPAMKPYPLTAEKNLVSQIPLQQKQENTSKISWLPSSFDWRNVNGKDYTTPVKNQMPAPTCEAYALCASLETMMQYQRNELYDPDLSETHLYFYSGGTCKAGGVLLGDAAEYLITTGVPDEGCFPDPQRGYDYPFDSIPGWEKRAVKITEWGWVDLNPTAMKKALIEHGPLVICVWQRMDFLMYHRGVYKPIRLLPVENGHVITIVGYDDMDECWIVKNSAGSSWGEQGYVRLHYEAHTEKTPIFTPFYGGTGVLYIDGVYGNLKPDVPKIYITNLNRKHTYIRGREIPTLIKDLDIEKKALARIIEWTMVTTEVENADGVRFYLDGNLIALDDTPPFSCKVQADTGIHTIEAIAFNDHAYAMDLRDVYMF